MSADELWSFREELRLILSRKLDAEKRELERRLARLNRSIGHEKKRADLTRRSIQNIVIRSGLLKPGPDAEDSRSG